MTTVNFQVLKLNKRKLVTNSLLLPPVVLVKALMIIQPEKCT